MPITSPVERISGPSSVSAPATKHRCSCQHSRIMCDDVGRFDARGTCVTALQVHHASSDAALGTAEGMPCLHGHASQEEHS